MKKLHITPMPEQQISVLADRLASLPEYQNLQPKLAEKWKADFIAFCRGHKTLPLTYDPFFKRIFHPDVNSGRLSALISALLGRRVRVVAVLPNENSMFVTGSLIVMDILVQLEDGSLCCVEIQKIPYLFPAERISCYSADILLRQYNRIKKEKGKAFKYSDIKKVYTIVIFETSTSVYATENNDYIHRGRTAFDTEINLDLLQEFCLVTLDRFKKSPYANSINELNGWLHFLSTENAEDAEKLIGDYPWLEPIYQEMFDYLKTEGEVFGMFSEALYILDRNTTQYMIEELQDELKEKDSVIRKKDSALEKKDSALKKKDTIIKAKDSALKKKDSALKKTEKELSDAQNRIRMLEEQLKQQ